MLQIKRIKLYIALVVAIVLPIFAYKIYTGPVFDAWDIKSGEVREALCVPIQQLKRVDAHRADMLIEEQAAQMEYYFCIPVPTGHGYVPFTTDYSKVLFSSESYNNDPIAFWKFYLEIGLQFPKDYIVAFLSNTLGFWYPGADEFTYVAWILIMVMILAWKNFKQYLKVLPVFLPLIAQFGIMLLSPMASYRYSWPFFLLLPISFVAVWYSGEKAEPEDKKEN